MILGYDSTSQNRKWLGTILVLLIAAALREAAGRNEWLDAAYTAGYILWIWLPTRLRTWRNDTIIATTFILGLIVASRVAAWQPLTANLLYPCAGLLALTAPEGPYFWVGLAGIAAGRYLMSPLNITGMAGNILGLSGIYLAYYGSRLRRQAQALDKRRVAELEQAYATLQSTHQQLVETTAEVAESRAREERLRMATDIHDGVGHRLTSLIIGLESIELMLPQDLYEAQTRLPNLVTTARQALLEVRQAVHARDDSPSEFDGDSFQQLIAAAARDGEWDSSVTWSGNPEAWSTPVRITLFRVLQESLTNILRHAKARHVAVSLLENEEWIKLEIADDGLLSAPVTPGFGLSQMQNRCRSLGGSFTWREQHPHGLVVMAKLPLAEASQ